MKEIKVNDSANIKTIFYNSNKSELWVFFKSNTLYIYSKVSNNVVMKLIKSNEKGKFFSECIKNSHEFTQKY